MFLFALLLAFLAAALLARFSTRAGASPTYEDDLIFDRFGPPLRRSGFLRVLGLVVAVVFYAGGALAADGAAAPAGLPIDGVLRFIAEHFGTILLFATPLILAAIGGLWAKLSRPQQDTLLGSVKGAYAVVAAIAPRTQMTWDDAVALLLGKVADDLGRKLKPKEVARAKSIAAALLADPARPDVVVGDAKLEALRRALVPR